MTKKQLWERIDALARIMGLEFDGGPECIARSLRAGMGHDIRKVSARIDELAKQLGYKFVANNTFPYKVDDNVRGCIDSINSKLDAILNHLNCDFVEVEKHCKLVKRGKEA